MNRLEELEEEGVFHALTHEKVISFPLQHGMRLYMDNKIEIAGLSTVKARFAFPGYSDPGTLFDTLGNGHPDRLNSKHVTASTTLRADLACLAMPLALRAGLSEMDRAFSHIQTSGTIARRTCGQSRMGIHS